VPIKKVAIVASPAVLREIHRGDRSVDIAANLAE